MLHFQTQAFDSQKNSHKGEGKIRLICTEKIRTFELILYPSKMKNTEKARFDTRLTKDQKDLFEYAANLGGFRTLSDFVIVSAKKKRNTFNRCAKKKL